jgi:ADP-ribose pyrophosphatase YjhB (NUDIX family)
MNNTNYCNNCGIKGHIFYQCKHPITSVGIIVYKKKVDGVPEYLMIRRKDSIGFIEFMRGKYQVQNKLYLLNIISEMTNEEKTRILTTEFDELWKQLWGDNINVQYRGEEKISNEKFNTLKNGVFDNNNVFFSTKTLIDECNSNWMETEWGFPKGRHNKHEKDIICALREFEEETGYLRSSVNILHNITPLEEIFTGSNYKSYKHKYYIAYMLEDAEPHHPHQYSEVSKLEWKTYENALESIRPYNLEKKEVLTKVNTILNTYKIYDNV